LARAPNSGERKRYKRAFVRHSGQNVEADWGSFQLGHDGIYADIGTQTSLFRVTSSQILPSSGTEGQNGDSYGGFFQPRMLRFLICLLSAAAVALGIYVSIVGPDAWAWLCIVMIILGYFGQIELLTIELLTTRVFQIF
jgi:hypothetical protein